MKVKVSHLLASLAAVFLLNFSVEAQDELPIRETLDPNHQETTLDEDKTLMYEHPGHTSTVKDSVPRIFPIQTIKPLKADNHKSIHKDEEDALSFNFLFYMFQKFKMSDWIDQE